MSQRHLKICLLLTVVILFFSSSGRSLAQKTEDPVVYAVLFYSPTCPHCHETIQNVLLPLMDDYGKQLVVIGLDITTEAGHYLYQNAVNYYKIPETRQGVPTLIIEDTVLVSTLEIENEFPGLIEAGLAAGGTHWPEFPELVDVLIELTPTAGPEPTAAATKSMVAAEETKETAVATPILPTETPTATPVAPTRDDIPTFSLAEIDPPTPTTETGPPLDPVGFLLGWLVVVGLGAVLLFSTWKIADIWPALTRVEMRLSDGAGRSVVMWMLIGVGLIVSGYLAYVEVTQVTAVCGPVGECNIVQSSVYAHLFGVPIAVWGSLFYLTSAALWQLQRVAKLRQQAALSLLVSVYLGVLFSLYLTLLELLVIGAICAWCLTSAVVTGAICLLVTTGMTKPAVLAQSAVANELLP